MAEVAKDGLFFVGEMECMGFYTNAPMITYRYDVPSIAAVVSSRKLSLISRYRASVRAQSTRVDMIDSLFKPVAAGKDDGMIRYHPLSACENILVLVSQQAFFLDKVLLGICVSENRNLKMPTKMLLEMRNLYSTYDRPMICFIFSAGIIYDEMK